MVKSSYVIVYVLPLTSATVLISLLFLLTTTLLNFGLCWPIMTRTTSSAIPASAAATVFPLDLSPSITTAVISSSRRQKRAGGDYQQQLPSSSLNSNSNPNESQVQQQPPPSEDDDKSSSARIERSTKLSQITGTTRKIRMFIRNQYLQIFANGSVKGTTDVNSDYTILQRISHNAGQVQIQGVATCLFLCIDSCGLLFGSKNPADECTFHELIGQHNYNMYTSAKYSDDKRTMYIGLNKKGEAKKIQTKTGDPLGKNVSFTKVLPMTVTSQQLEQLTSKILSANPITSGHHVRHHQICNPVYHHHTKLTESPKCAKRKKRRKMQRNSSSNNTNNKCLDDHADECGGKPYEHDIKQHRNNNNNNNNHHHNNRSSSSSSNHNNANKKKCPDEDLECHQRRQQKKSSLQQQQQNNSNKKKLSSTTKQLQHPVEADVPVAGSSAGLEKKSTGDQPNSSGSIADGGKHESSISTKTESRSVAEKRSLQYNNGNNDTNNNSDEEQEDTDDSTTVNPLPEDD